MLQLYPENSEQVQPINQSGRGTGREIICCLGLSMHRVLPHQVCVSVLLASCKALQKPNKITCKEDTQCNFCCFIDCLGLSLKIKVAGHSVNLGLKTGCSHQHCTVTQGWKIQPSIPLLESLLCQLTQARLRSRELVSGWYCRTRR